MTTLVDQSIQLVRSFLSNEGVAKSRLATMAKVPEGCTRTILNEDWNPTIDTLRKLESALPESYRKQKKSKKSKSSN
jgi:ribosome-binding protein aMBF1 (putative translation factor)